MVEEIFDFDETKAVEIYTPFDRIVGIDEKETIQDLKKLVVKTGHSRFPVFNDIKEIIGIVHLKDGLLKDKNIEVNHIMKSVLKISPNMKVDNVLRKMQKKKVHMAVLETKKNKNIGLVTMEDLIEEIFGDIKAFDFLKDEEAKHDRISVPFIAAGKKAGDGHGDGVLGD